MNKEEKAILFKETYEYLQKTDFDKIDNNSDIYLDYIMLYEEYKQLKDNWNKLKDKINSMLSDKTFEDRIMSIVLKNILKIMQELEKGNSND